MYLHSLPFLVQVGVAQQWYDELDYIAAPKPEHEIPKDDRVDKNIVVEDDDKIHINSSVCTSPGTSEVCSNGLFCFFTAVFILHAPGNFPKIPTEPFLYK
jgi:hypothetical protein